MFLFALIICLSTLPASAATEAYAKPDIPYVDGAESFANPATGSAGGGWTTFKPEGLPNWHGGEGFHSSLWELSRFSGGREQNGKRPPDARVGGKDIPLTVEMTADVRRFLTETRQKGGTLIVRLGYTWSEYPGCEPSDFNILLGHVATLSKILADFDDVVVAVEAGIAGPWGEMHSSDYCGAEYMNRILKTYIDNLGPRIPVLVRAPNYFNKLAGTKTEELLGKIPFKDSYLKRLGMYNDGYLGTWWDYGTWAGDFIRERGVTLLAANPNAPYGGEMAYIGRDWLEKNMKVFQPDQWNIVKEWYETHLTYLRNLGERGHTLADFLTSDLTFRTNVYAWAKMPNLAEYDGTNMNKFVRDHMGYRFVVRSARLPIALSRAGLKPSAKKSKSAAGPLVALKLENTGFGQPLLPLRAEILWVREAANVQRKATALGTLLPQTLAERTSAYPTTADLVIPGGSSKLVGFPLTGWPTEAGDYTVYVRVSMPCADEVTTGEMPRRAVRFANAGMWEPALRANRLGKITIK